MTSPPPTGKQSTGRSGYMPSLDGWRAIAVLGVMFTHDFVHRLGGYSLAPLHEYGGEGVLLFFSISGVLICTRLLEEEDRLGRFNLKSFYVRRILRIQPAAWLYLAVVAALMLSGVIYQWWRFWFGALLLYRNYQVNVLSAQVGAYGYFTGHFWTLAVEEHFYILLSLGLFFVRKRRLAWMTGLYLLCVLWPHVLPQYAQQATAVSQGRYTEFQLQWLILPATIAVLYRQRHVRSLCERWLLPWVAFSAPLLFGCLWVLLRYRRAALHWDAILLPGLLWMLMHACTLWIIATISHPRSWTTRLLETPPLRWIGRLSYSLYLWHVLFFRGVWPAEIPQPQTVLLRLTHAPWNFMAAFACAAASFYLVERPLMRLGHRLAPPLTPGRRDMRDEPSLVQPLAHGTRT